MSTHNSSGNSCFQAH